MSNDRTPTGPDLPPLSCPRCNFAFGAEVPEPGATGAPTLLPAGQSTGPGRAEHPVVVERFRVDEFLGEGAFGRVYRAYDPSLKRTVALNVARSSALSAEALERFEREARAAAVLQHPNIVAVYDAGRASGGPYIASAFVPGRSLDLVLAGRAGGERLPLRQAVDLVKKLAEALAYAHRNGIVHRDVKPGNVMLRDDGEPMLMDFGLAARSDEERLTREGQALGTPAYMAPEQWRGKADAASDQYALGCVLYELVTGRPPFVTGGDVGHYLFLHLHQPAPTPRKFRRDLPRDLETVALRCLEKEPQKRYADCQALADDLRRWLADEPVTARRPGAAERAWRWARRNPAVTALAATVFVVLTAGVVASTLFALDAREKEKLAEERAEQVDEQRRIAVARTQEALRREQETARALDELETTLVEGLVRPIGREAIEFSEQGWRLTPLSISEVDTFLKVRDVRSDRTLRRLMRAGVAGPEVAASIGRCAPWWVGNIVRFNRSRRKEMESLLIHTVGTTDSPEVKLACLWLGQELDTTSPAWAVGVAGGTLAALDTADRNSGEWQALLRGLDSVCRCLSADEVARVVARPLVAGMKNATNAARMNRAWALAHLGAQVSPEEATRQAGSAAEVLTLAMQSANDRDRAALAGAMVALSPSLGRAATEKYAEKSADALVSAMPRANGYDLLQLAAWVRTVSDLLGRPKGQRFLADAARVLAAVYGKAADRDRLSMAAPLISLSESLGQAEADGHAANVAQAAFIALREARDGEVGQCASSLREVAGKLAQPHAEKVAAALTAALPRVKPELELLWVTQALMAALGKVSMQDADRHLARVTDVLVAALPVAKGYGTQSLASTAELLAPRLNQTMADRVASACITALPAAGREEQRGLAKVLAAVSQRLGQAVAERAAASAIVAFATASGDQVKPLLEALAALSAQLSRPAAEKTATALVAAFRRDPIPEVTGLAGALVAVLGRLPKARATRHARMAAKALMTSLEDSEDADQAPLAEALVAVTELLGEAAAARAAEAIEDALDDAGEPEMFRVAKALGQVSRRLRGPDGSEAAARAAEVYKAALVQPSDWEELAAAGEALVAVSDRLNRDRLFDIAKTLLAIMVTVRGADLDDYDFWDSDYQQYLRRLESSLAALSHRLDTQDLASLLAHPLCAGPARRALLDVLGQRCRRHFRNTWHFIDWADANGVDFPAMLQAQAHQAGR